ncbi:MAG: Fic family protein [Opitutales bacterium]|jgi:Fic family protein|nr:Fic family protein [Opitutales bacterium]
MRPLMPEQRKAILADISSKILRKSGELKRALSNTLVRNELAGLVRTMNSYYSNLIEGHKTLPKDIDKALRQDFSESRSEQRNQMLSVAHIETETAMRERLFREADLDPFSESFLCWIHREFYSRLPESEWTTTSLTGKTFPLKPGELRGYNVDVGQHTPPDHSALPDFLETFRSCYTGKQILATDQLIAAAAAHHRLAWIHPFGDGNGRVTRLHSQAVMIRCKVDCEGLWTLSRGLARNRKTYYQQLALADQTRQSDLDGRGNLSDSNLADFCVYFLTTLLDQIEFMLELMELKNLNNRVEQYIRFQLTELSSLSKDRIVNLLHVLIHKGELARGSVQSIFGLKASASRELIQICFAQNLIHSATPKGPLRISFNADVLEFYFPKLFTDLPVD